MSLLENNNLNTGVGNNTYLLTEYNSKADESIRFFCIINFHFQ